MASKEYDKRRAFYQRKYRVSRGKPIPAYKGFSKFNENSTAASFHEAVKQAAEAAARAAGKENVDLPAWFEVTRVQVLVGNPNVKVYGVEGTWTGGEGPP